MRIRELVEEHLGVCDVSLWNVMVRWGRVSFARGREGWSSSDVKLPGGLVRRRTEYMVETSW